MKLRLFWKILIGFWLTVLLITHGTWFTFNRISPQPEGSEYDRATARMAVTAATSAIRAGGIETLNRQIANWPARDRDLLKIQPDGAAVDTSRVLATTAITAPDGKRYRISYLHHVVRGGNSLLRQLMIPPQVLVVAAGGGLIFSAVLAWYLTRPVRRLRSGFDRLARGDFAVRLGPAMGRRRDEIADLAREFDRMAVHLEELVRARDRLLADVSHELRTPLARLNVAIELARQDASKCASSLDRIGAEAEKLDEMVGEVLTLAKLESGQAREGDYANLAEIVKGVVRDARYEASIKGVGVSQFIEPDTDCDEWIVKGNGKLISRAVENVVRNAIRFSPQGGNVSVRLRRESGLFRLLVEDEGPGVTGEAMNKLFQPFSISADGFGFGLGLAIAQRAIAVHGGSILARNRQPSGLQIAIDLPSASVEPE